MSSDWDFSSDQLSEDEVKPRNEETKPSEESSNNNHLGSSSGGCELGFGSLIIFGLLGVKLALKRR